MNNYLKISILGITFITLSTVISISPVKAVENVNKIINVQSSDNLLQQGKSLYEAGRYAEAAQIWQQTAENFNAQRDKINQALSLNYLSLAYQELGQLPEAESTINLSLKLLPQTNELEPLLAQILNTQGSLQLLKGESEQALNTWEKAEEIYQKSGDILGVFGAQINQVQALQSLGFYRRSQNILKTINQDLATEPDSLIKANALRSLGVTLQNIGNLQEAVTQLEQSLTITENLNLPSESSATLFSLGNTSKALQKYDLALNYYQQAAQKSPSSLVKLEAQINQVALLAEQKKWTEIENLLPEIKEKINQLSASRTVIYAQVNLAQTLIKMGTNSNLSKPENIAPILTRAIQQSQEIGDTNGESYSLGILGKLYENNGQLIEAKQLTEKALKLSQNINSPHITYQWQWQLGRILKSEGKLENALASYSSAVQILQSLRGDLVAMNPNVQFSFRDSIEPVYRELVSLLLTPETNNNISNKQQTKTVNKLSQDKIIQAREVIESLQVAELENFFREACLEAVSKQIDEIDTKAAVIYPIILPDKLAVIISLPGEELSYYVTDLPQEEVDQTLDQLFQSLNPAFSNQLRLKLSQQVYDWIIRPTEKQLEGQKIETLVFVLDGVLRNIPMSALHDGEKYLIEKYQVALTPGLNLLEPKAITKDKLSAVMGGLSESRQGFTALPGVESEIAQISSNVTTAQLLNQDFTSEKLKEQIQNTPFPILHLATHGQFSSYPAQTFIITWDTQIGINEFEEMIETRQTEQLSPIELLVLSACETAAGDKYATLGLAGMAVRSGARSTIATLWAVKDQSTALLMTEFYENLSQTLEKNNKAQSLRKAQLELLNSEEYNHPFYWAPFILVGNWL